MNVYILAMALALHAQETPEVRGAEGLKALVGADARIHLTRGQAKVFLLSAGLFTEGWIGAEAIGERSGPEVSPTRRLSLAVPGGGLIKGSARVDADQGKLRAEYVFNPEQDSILNSLHLSADFSIASLAGGTWTADDKSGRFPAAFSDPHLFNAPLRKLKLTLPSGFSLEFEFSEPTPVLLQDNRKWGPSFAIRIHRSSTKNQPFKKGVPVRIGFTLTASGGISVEQDAPVTLAAGPEWVPLKQELEIQGGTALDFSTQGFQDAPAGKYGWVQASPEGHFHFEKDPASLPRRFYGVNLCFSAQYLAHEQADRLAERLMRLGYNSVRIHHYEGELVSGQRDSVTLNPAKLDQLDYLLAAFFKRGLYVTTDLFVSRPIPKSEIGRDGGGQVGMDDFKILVPVLPKAFENWKTFARNLLVHVNPYTGRSYAREPGLAWLALINEGNLGNFFGKLSQVPEWRAAWNRWLADRYGDREGLARAWGQEWKDGEDPHQGSVGMASSLRESGLRARDAIVFLAWSEQDFFQRAAAFLRGELGVKALLTNMSSWTNRVTDQATRTIFDFVDDHFYVDHPKFLEQPWRLPSRCPNTSPVAEGAAGGRPCAFTRLLGKPFTITEYNYSSPGRFRGVGGILAGTLGALQDWDGIWRFAYSHNREQLFAPSAMRYFDMASDPLSQASERASLCLFLRRDLRPAPTQCVVVLDEQQANRLSQIPNLAPSWHWMAWISQVATLSLKGKKGGAFRVVCGPCQGTPARFLEGAVSIPGLDPYQADPASMNRQLPQGDRSDPGANRFVSPQGEVTIDAPRDTLILDTERTAGGYAPAGQELATRHGVAIRVREADATVWVSSLDQRPIVTSKRLLVTHLTDLQNTGIRYAESARQTLLDWGGLPHLVRAGKAEIRLTLEEAGSCRVWALSTGGRRVAEVPIRVEGRQLVFTTDVAGFLDHGAILCYEIARE